MENEKGNGRNLSRSLHWRTFISVSILALMGLFNPAQLESEVYQWIDENGVKHYSNLRPADRGNFRKSFDEYEYDQSADQERIQSDQKAIDELDEQLEKERQSMAAEPEKIEEDKQNHSNLFVFECFSPSLSVQQGKGVSEKIEPRDLSEAEYFALTKFFPGLNGSWSGNARTVSCQEWGGQVVEELEHFTIRSEGKMNSTGMFVLESELYSKENRTKTRHLFRLYLSKYQLAARYGVQEPDIELISLSSDELIYLEKRDVRSGGIYAGGRHTLETLTAIKRAGQGSFSLESVKYWDGKSIAISSWHQRRE